MFVCLFVFPALISTLASCSLMRKHFSNSSFGESHSFHGHLDSLWHAQAQTWWFNHRSLLGTRILSFFFLFFLGRELNSTSRYYLRKEDWEWKCFQILCCVVQVKTPFPTLQSFSLSPLHLSFLQFGAVVPNAFPAEADIGMCYPFPGGRDKWAAGCLPSSSSPALSSLWKHMGLCESGSDLSTRIVSHPLQFIWKVPHLQTSELYYV